MIKPGDMCMGILTRIFPFKMPSQRMESVALASGETNAGMGFLARRGVVTPGGRSLRHAGAQMQETAQSVEQVCEQMRDILRRIDAQMDIRARRDPQILDALDKFETMQSQFQEWHLQYEQIQSAMEDTERVCRDTLDAQRLILTHMAQREELAAERHDELVMSLRRLETMTASPYERPELPLALPGDMSKARASADDIATLSARVSRSTLIVGLVALGSLAIGTTAILLVALG
jgi:hypothetical protein